MADMTDIKDRISPSGLLGWESFVRVIHVVE